MFEAFKLHLPLLHELADYYTSIATWCTFCVRSHSLSSKAHVQLVAGDL